VWFGDFRAVLWIMLGKEFVVLVLSHLLAKRPYRWAWHRDLVKRMLAFGWPLLFNGFVMFVSRQGDQMLVGANFSLADLAVYSIAFTLSSLPFSVFAQVGSSLMLPTLASQQKNPENFKTYYNRCIELAVIISLIILGPLVLVGGDIVRFIYGPRYSGSGMLVAIFSAGVALRFFRWAPTVAAMSRADTVNQLLGNIARAMSLLFAFLVIASGRGSMAGVAACGLIGEILAIFVSVVRVKKRQNIGYYLHLKPFIFLIGWICAGAIGRYLFNEAMLLTRISALISVLALGMFVAFFLFSETVSMLRGAAKDIKVLAFMRN